LNKKRYFLLGLLGFLCIMVIAIYVIKPNESEFVKWFQEKYDVQCEDADCYVIKIENNSEASKGDKFWNAEGYYDTSTGFLAMGMQTKRLYKNVNDPNQFFSIEVKGFLGNFEVIQTRQNKVNILTN